MAEQYVESGLTPQMSSRNILSTSNFAGTLLESHREEWIPSFAMGAVHIHSWRI